MQAALNQSLEYQQTDPDQLNNSLMQVNQTSSHQVLPANKLQKGITNPSFQQYKEPGGRKNQ